MNIDKTFQDITSNCNVADAEQASDLRVLIRALSLWGFGENPTQPVTPSEHAAARRLAARYSRAARLSPAENVKAFKRPTDGTVMRQTRPELWQLGSGGKWHRVGVYEEGDDGLLYRFNACKRDGRELVVLNAHGTVAKSYVPRVAK